MTFYSSSRHAPVISGTIDVVPNQLYQVGIEVMRTDTDSETEKVSNIKMNSESFGSCNPDGAQHACTYYDCSHRNHGDYLIKTSIRSSTGQIAVELNYSGGVNLEATCTWNNIKVTAVARVSLTPI